MHISEENIVFLVIAQNDLKIKLCFSHGEIVIYEEKQERKLAIIKFCNHRKIVKLLFA